MQKLCELNNGKYMQHTNGVLQGHKRQYKTIWGHARPYRIIRDYTGPFRNIQNHMEPYGAIRDHAGSFEAIQGYSGSNRAVQSHTGRYGTIHRAIQGHVCVQKLCNTTYNFSENHTNTHSPLFRKSNFSSEVKAAFQGQMESWSSQPLSSTSHGFLSSAIPLCKEQSLDIRSVDPTAAIHFLGGSTDAAGLLYLGRK